MKRYAYVDLLRGFAALAVLICHYRWFYARHPGDWRDVPLPADDYLWPIYGYGGMAVQLFWILSGFVFAVAYGQYGKGLSVREFWLRRFSRLYPLHFATLLIVAALQAVSMVVFGTWQIYGNNDVQHFILQLFLASNWFSLDWSFNGPIWSVSIEELVYIGFLIYLKAGGLSLRNASIVAVVSLVLAGLTQNLVVQCSALFFAGVAIAIVMPRFSWRMPVAIIACATVLGLYVLLALADFEPWIPTLLIYLGTPSLLLLFISLDYRFELPRQFHWIGASTYAIYLLHMPVLILLRMTVGIVPLWAFAGIVIALAVPTYYWFEAPMQRWIRSRTGIKPRTAAASAMT